MTIIIHIFPLLISVDILFASVIPQLGQCHGAVSLWQQCVGQESVYSVSAESFLVTLASVYSNKATNNIADTGTTSSAPILYIWVCVPCYNPHVCYPVFSCLVERMLDQRLPLRGSRDIPVTVFQLWTYLEANDISDMETHICELAEEGITYTLKLHSLWIKPWQLTDEVLSTVWLVQNLASSDQDVNVHALRHCAECSLKREGLQAVAKLLKDPRGRVSALASSVLRGLATQPGQREQVRSHI